MKQKNHDNVKALVLLIVVVAVIIILKFFA